MDTTIFEKLNTQVQEDTQIDEINLKDKQLRLPGLKHKYVGELIRSKQELIKLKKLREDTKKTIRQQVIQTSKVGISDNTADRTADAHEIIRKIDEKIEEQCLIIEYLEKVEAIFRNFTFDIKNMIEIIKLETQ